MQTQEEWVQKQQQLLRGDNKNDILPKRKYLHFDYRINKLSDELLSYIFDKNAVTAHSFYPFIQYTKRTRRRKKSIPFNGYEYKERPISFSSHLDSLIYSWYSSQLSNIYEEILKQENISDSVTAYRSGTGSNIDHACRAFRDIKDLDSANVVCIDVKSFFNNLSHSHLKKSWLSLISFTTKSFGKGLPKDHYAVYKAITKFSYVLAEDVYKALDLDPKNPSPTLKSRLCNSLEFRSKIAKKGLIEMNNNGVGIPQGSSMSALLANLYMFDFDVSMNNQVSQWGGKYYRYSDDIIVITPNTISIPKIEEYIQSQIKKVKLTISSEKTEKFHFRNEKGILTSRNSDTNRKKNLNYLGMSFDGRRILLKHASLVGYQRKVVSAVKGALKYAYKNNTKLPRKTIYERYTRLGNRNYQTYVQRCVRSLKKHGFDSGFLKRQASDFFVHKTIKRLKS